MSKKTIPDLHRQLTNCWQTLNRIEAFLRDYSEGEPRIAKHTQHAARVTAIIAAAANVFSVHPDIVKSHTRVRKAVSARFATYVIAVELAGLRRADLCRIFEADHSSVTHGIKSAKGWIETDLHYREAVEQIKQAVRNEMQP